MRHLAYSPTLHNLLHSKGYVTVVGKDISLHPPVGCKEAERVTALLKKVVYFVVVVTFGIGAGLIAVAVTGSEDTPVAYISPLISLFLGAAFLRVLGIRESSRSRGSRTYYPSAPSDYSSDHGYSGGGGDSGGSTGGDGGGS